MLKITVNEHSSASPEEVLALAGTDFSANRAHIWPNVTTRKLEVHLIGFQGDLVGQPLAVDLIERLRDTRPFAGPAALVEQLCKDVEEARRLAGG